MLFSVSCHRENRKDSSDRGIDSGDWRAGGEAASHGGRHTWLRRRHQQPGLVRNEEFFNTQTFVFTLASNLPTDSCLFLRHPLNARKELNFPLPVSTPSSATSTTSLSATSTTRAASIADTSSTTGFTAASTSSPRSATGESRRAKPLSLSHRCLSIPSSRNTEIWSVSLTRCPSVSCATSLKPLDVQFMKAIHNKVNVVPVIAKADTLTLKERERLKRRVRAALGHCSWNERLLPRTHRLHCSIHCTNKKFSIRSE